MNETFEIQEDELYKTLKRIFGEEEKEKKPSLWQRIKEWFVPPEEKEEIRQWSPEEEEKIEQFGQIRRPTWRERLVGRITGLPEKITEAPYETLKWFNEPAKRVYYDKNFKKLYEEPFPGERTYTGKYAVSKIEYSPGAKIKRFIEKQFIEEWPTWLSLAIGYGVNAALTYLPFSSRVNSIISRASRKFVKNNLSNLQKRAPDVIKTSKDAQAYTEMALKSGISAITRQAKGMTEKEILALTQRIADKVSTYKLAAPETIPALQIPSQWTWSWQSPSLPALIQRFTPSLSAITSATPTYITSILTKAGFPKDIAESLKKIAEKGYKITPAHIKGVVRGIKGLTRAEKDELARKGIEALGLEKIREVPLKEFPKYEELYQEETPLEKGFRGELKKYYLKPEGEEIKPVPGELQKEIIMPRARPEIEIPTTEITIPPKKEWVAAKMKEKRADAKKLGFTLAPGQKAELERQWEEKYGKKLSTPEVAAPTVVNQTLYDNLISNELSIMWTEVEEGSPGKRYRTETGEWKGQKSTYPEWMKRYNLTRKQIEKALQTKKGKTYDLLVDIAKNRMKNGYESSLIGKVPPNSEYLKAIGKVKEAEAAEKLMTTEGLPFGLSVKYVNTPEGAIPVPYPKEYFKPSPKEPKSVNFIDVFIRPPHTVFKAKGAGDLWDEVNPIMVDWRDELIQKGLKIRGWKEIIGKDPEVSQRLWHALNGTLPGAVMEEGVALPPKAAMMEYDKLVRSSLSPQEYRVYKLAREILDDLADRLGLEESERIKNYIIHIFEKSVETTKKGENPLPEYQMIFTNIKPKEVFASTLLKRLGKKEGLKTDFWDSMDAVIRIDLRKIYGDKISEAIDKWKESKGEIPGDLNDYINKWYTQAVLNWPTAVDKWINNTLEPIINKLPQNFKEYLGDNPAQTLAYLWTRLGYSGTMMFNMNMVTRNASQPLMTLGLVSEKNWARAFEDLIKFALKKGDWKTVEAILNSSTELKNRFPAEYLNASGISKLERAGMFLYKGVDWINCAQSYLAGYYDAIDKGMPHDLAKQAGDTALATSQYVYRPWDMPGIAWRGGAVGRASTMLTTWPMNYFTNYWPELLHRAVAGEDINGYKLTPYERAGIIRYIIYTGTAIYLLKKMGIDYRRIFGLRVIPTQLNPILNAIYRTGQIFFSDNYEERKEALRSLKNSITVNIPTYLQSKRLIQSYKNLIERAEKDRYGRIRRPYGIKEAVLEQFFPSYEKSKYWELRREYWSNLAKIRDLAYERKAAEYKRDYRKVRELLKKRREIQKRQKEIESILNEYARTGKINRDWKMEILDSFIPLTLIQRLTRGKVGTGFESSKWKW